MLILILSMKSFISYCSSCKEDISSHVQWDMFIGVIRRAIIHNLEDNYSRLTTSYNCVIITNLRHGSGPVLLLATGSHHWASGGRGRSGRRSDVGGRRRRRYRPGGRQRGQRFGAFVQFPAANFKRYFAGARLEFAK